MPLFYWFELELVILNRKEQKSSWDQRLGVFFLNICECPYQLTLLLSLQNTYLILLDLNWVTKVIQDMKSEVASHHHLNSFPMSHLLSTWALIDH